MAGTSLKQSAINGSKWKVIERFTNYLISFLVGIILARLLDPSDYGTVGILSVFFALAYVFQDSGFGTALIQRQNPTQIDYSTVFVFNVCSSIAIYVLFFLLAPLIAEFYNTPILKDVTRVSALSFIISGLTGVQYSKLNIDLKFSLRSKLSIAGTILSGIIGVLLAFLGCGIWALVFQGLISSFIIGVVLWKTSGWSPSFAFSSDSFKSLFKFGGNMLGSGLINCLYGNLYTMVIGKAFSPYDVGMYNRANGYASIPANLVSDISTGVNFPILAKIKDDNSKLIVAYEKLLRVPYYVLYPILIGIIVLANPLIQVMIGDKWLPCVPYLQILCVGYMFYPLNGFNMNLLYVKGRSDLALKTDFIKKPIGILLLLISLPFGIIWMMVGKALYSIIVYSINCYYTKKILDYGFLKQIKVLIPIIVSSCIMGVSVWCSTFFIDSNILKIIVGFFVGVAVYIMIGALRKDQALFEIFNMIKKAE